ncbi:MAG: multifunctional CCA addition/repair protein [Steroidobacteraceae bacterium]
MQVYLVGGAVRDALLGREVVERDYVVVGATAAQLEAQGYRPVGRDFPVFLHPQTRAEHALARRERKTGPGYRGFVTEFTPDITLEEDLLRRDLTVNAMAEDDDGTIIDPYGGQRDLQDRWLRHVSDAFREDPVRILRAARFAARFAPLGFRVHPETFGLMRAMVDAGEAAALVAERVWQETERALGEQRPDVFFDVLRECGALRVIFPEVDRLYGVPQPERWHPEIDTGIHVMMCLRRAAELSSSTVVRFAVLTHDLGKGTTPQHVLPSHHGHEGRSVALVDGLCDRLRVPAAHRELARLVAELHGKVHRAFELRADTILTLLETCDAFRRPPRFADVLIACQADAQGRKGLENEPYPQRDYLARCRDAAAGAALTEEARQGLKGPAIADALRRNRLAAIETVRAAVAR